MTEQEEIIRWWNEFHTGTSGLVQMDDGRFLPELDEEFRVPGTVGFVPGKSHKIPNHLIITMVPHRRRWFSFDDFLWGWYHVRKNREGRYYRVEV